MQAQATIRKSNSKQTNLGRVSNLEMPHSVKQVKLIKNAALLSPEVHKFGQDFSS